MVKLKWKRKVVELCTPFGKHHDVRGYVHGELAVHVIPDSKPKAYSIMHIKTGMRVNGRRQPPNRTLAEAKEFATRMLEADTWCIESSIWGSVAQCKPERILALSEVVQCLLIEDGYRVDRTKYDPADNETVLHMCDCGKIAQRYILAIGKKWRHKCLGCEPYLKGDPNETRIL